MAKKTFIKVRRGILDPEHRRQMGETVWLFLYLLDRADWEEGTVFEYRDQDAAESLGMPLSTIRVQRRKLEEHYINAVQHQHYLNITIKKWENPKAKNSPQGDNEGDNEGDCLTTPSNDEGYNQGDRQGDNEGASELTPVHRIKKLRISDSQINTAQSTIDKDFVREFLATSGILSLSKNDQGHEIIALRDKYGVEAVMSAAAWLKEKRITKIEKALSSLRTALPTWTIPVKKMSTLDQSLAAIRAFEMEAQDAVV